MIGPRACVNPACIYLFIYREIQTCLDSKHGRNKERRGESRGRWQALNKCDVQYHEGSVQDATSNEQSRRVTIIFVQRAPIVKRRPRCLHDTFGERHVPKHEISDE